MKSKVTKIVKMDKKSNYGETSFIITFENGDSGFYNSKSEDQRTFVIGQEAEYDIEKKVGSTGKEYFKITVPAEQKAGGGFKVAKVDPKVQMISFSASYAKDLVVGKVVSLDQLEVQFERIYK